MAPLVVEVASLIAELVRFEEEETPVLFEEAEELARLEEEEELARLEEGKELVRLEDEELVRLEKIEAFRVVLLVPLAEVLGFFEVDAFS